jgi:hypothetical protein
MRTYQARLALDDDAPLCEYAGVFSRALRSLHAFRHAGSVVSKPRFMRAFGLTSRQYNAVKFSLAGMERSIVELRPGRISDLQQRIKAADEKLTKLRDPNPQKRKSKEPASNKSELPTVERRAVAGRAAESRARKIHHIGRRRADLSRVWRRCNRRDGHAFASARASYSTPSIILQPTVGMRMQTGWRHGKTSATRSSSCLAPRTRAMVVKAV